MSTQPGTCNCTDAAKNVSPGGARDASETTAKLGGVAEYVFRGTPCTPTFATYADKYRYLRGKAACSNGSISFPCCSATTLACPCTEVD